MYKVWSTVVLQFSEKMKTVGHKPVDRSSASQTIRPIFTFFLMIDQCWVTLLLNVTHHVTILQLPWKSNLLRHCDVCWNASEYLATGPVCGLYCPDSVQPAVHVPVTVLTLPPCCSLLYSPQLITLQPNNRVTEYSKILLCKEYPQHCFQYQCLFVYNCKWGKMMWSHSMSRPLGLALESIVVSCIPSQVILNLDMCYSFYRKCLLAPNIGSTAIRHQIHH